MASPRRTKNFAQDSQTPMFLYTILKQLDLRSIDWNQVAASLDISNGHAARMRYSRMRSQFEGIVNQTRATKPRKEKANEYKSVKDKTKGKRQLLEEENERLAPGQIGMGRYESQQHDSQKRIKLEPSFMGSPTWASSVTPVQQYASGYWNRPTIKTEPLTAAISQSPLIKKELDTSTAPNNNSPSEQLVKKEHDIKQEHPIKEEHPTNDKPSTAHFDHELRAPAVDAVKDEPVTTVMKQEPVMTPAFYQPNYVDRYGAVNVSDAYATAQHAMAYYNPHSTPIGTTPVYQMTQAYNYHPWLTPRHTVNQWSHPPRTSGAIAGSGDNLFDNNTGLGPHTTSYEELLNTPLYVDERQHPGFAMPASYVGQLAAQHVINSHSEQAVARAPSPDTPSAETKTAAKGDVQSSTTPSRASPADSMRITKGKDRVSSEQSPQPSGTKPDADAEHEVDPCHSAGVVDAVKVVIKSESVEILDP